MGYTTDFDGRFKFDKTLDIKTYNLLKGLATTRRVARDVAGEFGVEGEFYVDGSGDFGQANEDNIIDSNRPPKTQPGLWLQWIPTKDGNYLEWDEVEKFYEYVAWLEYLIDKVIKPAGFVLNGEVTWQGEESDDMGKIIVKDNEVTTKEGKVYYK